MKSPSKADQILPAKEFPVIHSPETSTNKTHPGFCDKCQTEGLEK